MIDGGDCTYYDEKSGQYYDLSALRDLDEDFEKENFSSTGNGLKYRMSICRALKSPCEDNPTGTVGEFLSSNEQACRTLTTLDQMTIQSIGSSNSVFQSFGISFDSTKEASQNGGQEQGVVITYKQATDGFMDMARQSQIRLVCDTGVSGNGEITEINGQGTANLLVTLKTPYACPSSGVNYFTLFMIGLVGAMVAYLAIGTFLNYRKGERGADLIPNREFWQSVPGKMTDGAVIVAQKAKGIYHSKFGNNNDYEDI